jgi:putative nucleotidyltransferase with HDIG domain
MSTSSLTRRLFWGAEALILLGTLAAAVAISHADEWQPGVLVALLLLLMVVGDWLSVETPAGYLSGALVATVLTMALLGPVPAMAFSIAAMIVTSASRRISPAVWLFNLTTFGLVALLGGLMIRALAGDIHAMPAPTTTQSVVFGLIVLGIFGVTVILNFVLFALWKRVEDGRSLARQVRELFLPLLPGQLAAGMLATILVVGYRGIGLPMLLGSIAILLILRYLTVALLRSEERADQLEARSIQLASLQFGVLATLMNALALRDRTTARHATAVARYAQALAIEVGCDEDEQEAIHTAGLLHDIGKFTWSDRVLHPQQLTDEDWAVIHRHPQDGATLVGKLDGYGPVADAILYHHERIDGGGYPAGLIGNEIPLASRIVSVCSTYDRMTARETYNTPMKQDEAIAELRMIAGKQLDAELVEKFIELLAREGTTIAGEDADFETELAFERRVRDLAAPRAHDRG